MSTNELRMRALRGATSVDHNDATAIVDATAALLEEMLAANGVDRADLVSLIFTATPDLTAAFPAAGARRIGISDVPLLCAAEIPVEGAVARVVRVLMHVLTDKGKDALRHVYLGEARRLRMDLFE